jgi:CRP-like cAMP-binding protein
MPTAIPVLAENRLLASLTRKDRLHFLSGCEQVELPFGNFLNKPNDTIRHVYFPTASFISLVTPIDGHSVEIALVGNEGMYGIPIMLGTDVSLLYAVVQGSGSAWRMSAKRFRSNLDDSVALRRNLNCYVHVLMGQLAQTAACNRFHVVEQRLARWLLMTRDRAHSDDFHITHEFLAQMLGVRRVGVTKAASALQKNKLIRYSRGNIRILDPAGLEAASCECYRVDKETYGRILHC